MVKQRTLKNSVSVTGVGLHSGEKVTLGLRPFPGFQWLSIALGALAGGLFLRAPELVVNWAWIASQWSLM